MTHDQISEALEGLCPGAEWTLSGDTYAGITWLDTKQTQPTEAAIDAYVAPLPAPSSVQVNSTSTPALNGVYAFDSQSAQNITSEALYIQVTTAQGAAKFTNGQTTKPWPDTSGALHTFTTTQFITFAEAIAQFTDSVVTASQAAGTPTWPSGPITIP